MNESGNRQANHLFLYFFKPQNIEWFITVTSNAKSTFQTSILKQKHLSAVVRAFVFLRDNWSNLLLYIFFKT